MVAEFSLGTLKMAILNIFKKKNFALPKEGETSLVKENPLDSKLHYGYDPDSEFKDRGNLFSSMQYSREVMDIPNHTREELSDVGIIGKFIKNILNSFENKPEIIETQSSQFQAKHNFEDASQQQSALRVSSNSELPEINLNKTAIERPAPDSFETVPTESNSGSSFDTLQVQSNNLIASNAGGSNSNQENDTSALDENLESDGQTLMLLMSTSSGNENQPVVLDIGYNYSGSSSNLTFRIAGVPNGVTLSAGHDVGNGIWELSANDLHNLTLTPETSWSGNLNLFVTVTADTNGNESSFSGSLFVTVIGVASVPTLSVSSANGLENAPISLSISAALTDTDGSEHLTIIISGVPSGGSLSAGINNGNGVWTLTHDQLVGLKLLLPSDFSGSLDLHVTATSWENTSHNAVTADLNVNISGVASAPILSVQSMTGLEDNVIPLVISLQSNDTGESLSVIISDMPSGSSLSAGRNNGDGTWTLTTAELADLTFLPPSNFSGQISLTVTAISSEDNTTAQVQTELHVVIEGVADAPNISVEPIVAIENTPAALNISASLNDDDGSETLVIEISGVPAGALLSAGIDNGNGSWSLTPAQLPGLTLTPSPYFSGVFNLAFSATSSENGTSATTNLPPVSVTVTGTASLPDLIVHNSAGIEGVPIALSISASLTDNDGSETLAIIISGLPTNATLSAGVNNGNGTWTLTASELPGLLLSLPANYNGTLHLSIDALATEGANTISNAASLDVIVTPVSHAPDITVSPATATEDNSVALNINVTPQDASGVLTVTIGNLPSGATLSAGMNNGDGTWTLTPAQLVGLNLNPAPNWNGSLNLSVLATSELNGTTSTSSTSLPLTIVGMADAPTLGVMNSSGLEDTPVTLHIIAALDHPSASENLSINISGLPAGATLSAGTDNGNGIWTLTAGQLTGLVLNPPAHFSGDITLIVKAISSDNGTTASTSSLIDINVSGVATQPVLNISPASGLEDNAIPLMISAALADTDGSETLSVTISNLPSGAMLSAGINNNDGTWTLTPGQLTGLTLLPPEHFSGLLALGISAVSAENGTTATASATMNVIVSGVATVPDLSVSNTTGLEDAVIPIAISASLNDSDSESLSILIKNVPAGVSFSAGVNNGDGSWSFTPAQLTGLTLSPPINFSGQINFTVAAISAENGTTSEVHLPLTVLISGVADIPSLSVQAASGVEGFSIPLHISASLTDTDGSESLSVIIGNVPSGATLSAGTNNHDGTWTLTSGQLTNLTITPPSYESGTLNLSVVAISSESGTVAQTESVTLPVAISGIADLPNLTVQAAIGLEDTATPLVVSASLTDTDGSETLSVVISDVPAGVSLSAGTDNGNGSWTLTASDLVGLKIIPPVNYSGNFILSVSVISTEGLTSAHVDATISVSISGVADVPNLIIQSASGLEGSAISLDIDASLIDTDGSETLSVIIGNVPVGASLSAGTNNHDGTWTLTSSQLANLTIMPAPHESGVFNLSVVAVASENGTTVQTLPVTLPLTITGSADLPTLAVQAAVGAEDTNILLTINAALTDTDGSDILSVVISGVPAGATLSAGINSGNGTWTLTGSELIGLTLLPPANYSGHFTLSVSAISAEGFSSAHVDASLDVTVKGIADIPSLTVQPATGYEGHSIELDISAALIDTDGSETLSVIIGNVPPGATLSAGTNNHDGTWTLASSQLANLSITPAPFESGVLNLSVTAIASENGTSAQTGIINLPVMITGVADLPILTVQAAVGLEDTSIPLTISAGLTDSSEILSINITGVPVGASLSAGIDNSNGSWTLTANELVGLTLYPPVNFSGNFTLGVSAVSTDGLSLAHIDANLNVTISSVPDLPTLNVQAAVGFEDVSFPLIINAGLTDISETLSVTISNLPAGATLSAGLNDGNGTWTLTAAQLTGLTLNPPANYSGNFTLGISAISTDGLVSAHVDTTLNVSISGVADIPNLAVQASSGLEGEAIGLIISSSFNDADGSETLSIIIGNVPSGAILSAGTNNHDGTWTLTSDQLTNLTITPPAHASGVLNLNVVAYVSEDGTSAHTSTISLPVTVMGVANLPTLNVQASTGMEDTAIPLVIGAGLVDTDGSETLSVVITGVPAGASLSAGTNNGNGSWTLTAPQLIGLTLNPPANFSGSITLGVSAISTEGLSSVNLDTTLSISVSSSADVPNLIVSAASGLEGGAIGLNISASLNDIDGSETLSIVIGNVPGSAILSAGTNNHDGTWTLTSHQLSGLTITPAPYASGLLNLSVTAYADENGTFAHTPTMDLPVAITGVADLPTLDVQAATGIEDILISLSIVAGLADADENLSVVISGVPVGATLSAGIDNGNGSWTLTGSELAGLTLQPPANYSGNFTLNVSAISSEELSLAHIDATLNVSVSGVADVPNLVVQAATGLEGAAIALNISASINDTDGSESLSVIIGNVPTGAVLSAGTDNHNGTWTLTVAQLTNLTITPAAFGSGLLNLSVTAITSENGTTAQSAISTLPVMITGVADSPLLHVQAAAGLEDTAIPLVITSSVLDADESLSLVISSVPSGASLSAGTNNGNGSWNLTQAQLNGLTIQPPSNWSGSFSLSVSAISMEGASTNYTDAVLHVSVRGVADAPNLSISAISGSENIPVVLNISASLNDTDGSENLSIIIGGVPSGTLLSAGVNNGNGTWTLTQAQLTGLVITPAAHWSGDIPLTITATSTEGSSTSSVTAGMNIHIAGIASAPLLAVLPASGVEDTAIALNISSALIDTDGSESLSIVISGIPAGASLSNGSNNGNGTWTLTQAQLTGLTFTPPQHASGLYNLSVQAISSENGTTAHTDALLPVLVGGVGTPPSLSVSAATGMEDTAVPLIINAALLDTDGSESLSIIIGGLPTGASLSAGINNGNGTWTLTSAQLVGLNLLTAANWSGHADLSVTAVSTENLTSANNHLTLPVTVTGIADSPVLHVHAVTGIEDTPIVLGLSATLADADGSETLLVTVSDVPAGATLSAGTDNGNGNWILTPAQLTGLTINPPSNFSGTFTLIVTATASEGISTASILGLLPVTIGGVADIPSLHVTAATGNEDTSIALNITATLTDTDSSENLSIIIGNVPSGSILSAGVNNGNGTWTLSASELSGLTFTPSSNMSGLVNLAVTATSSESGTSANAIATLPVSVLGIADAPNLSVHAVSGFEDTPVSLGIVSSLADNDGSEILSLTISGVPAGAALSAGINNGDGSWTLAPSQLTGLNIDPPTNYSGVFTLTVTATSVEGATSATTIGVIPVTISGIADAPTLSVSPALGNEDTPIALNISAALTDSSEALNITIGNVPSGAHLSAGVNNGNGTWTLLPAQLTGLTYTPTLNYSGLTTLSVTATSSENGAGASTVASLPVTVAGVADTPSLIVLPVTTLENASVALGISASLFDTDGSEILSITISGVPTGAVLSAGLNAGNGTWVLTPAQLTNLTLTPPTNYNGNFSLTVVALSSENATTGSISASLPVAVTGVGSTPTLLVSSAAGFEDNAIPLTIVSVLSDTSEVLSIVITGVPLGASLSHGLYAGNGKWSLSPSDLSGLTITPPDNYSGTIGLTVTAISTETNGAHGSNSAALTVIVSPVIDAPTLSVSTVTGNEDTAVSLNIAAAIRDTDGSETLTALITNVPLTASLSAGTNLGGGVWSLTASQLTNLKVIPPANSDADFTLTVTIKSTEANGATSSLSASLPVVVNAVADIPISTAVNTASLTNQVNLTISGSLSDTDGSETLNYVLHGVPDGFALNKGVNNGDNTWSLKPSDLAGLKMTAPEQFNGQLNLNVTAVSSETGGGSVSVSAATPFYARFANYASGYLVDLGVGVGIGGVGVGVHVGVLPDIDLLPATGGILGANGIYAKEDTPFLITDGAGILGLPVLSAVTGLISRILYSGIPAGVTFSTGTNLGGGVWQFTPAQLNNVTMNIPANSSADFTILVSAKLLTAVEIGVISVPVHVMGVADMPTLSVSAGAGTEDNSVALNISGALTDADGSEKLSFLVSGMPSGFTLNHGINNGNGTWGLLSSDLTGLTLMPKENFSGAVNLTVSAISTEVEGDQAVKQQSLSVNITAATDAPIITAVAAQTNEDQPVTLNLGISLRDTDGSEHLSAVTISGLPVGASLLGATDNHNGTWSVDINNLNQVQFVPPANGHGDFNLSITAISRETSTGSTASTTSSIAIHVNQVADAPITTATDSTGDMGNSISLHLGAALADTDGSESLTTVIAGVPDHAMLSTGVNNGDGTWTLTANQLSGLSLTPPDNFIGDLSLSLTAYSRDGNNSVISSHQGFTVHVLAPAMSMMSMSFDENDLFANQNGWTDNTSSILSDASSSAAEYFTNTVTPNIGSDHDQAFQNHSI